MVQVQFTSSSTSLFDLPSFSRAFLIGHGAVSMNLWNEKENKKNECRGLDQPEHAAGVLSGESTNFWSKLVASDFLLLPLHWKRDGHRLATLPAGNHWDKPTSKA